jgi:hypothetical protein
VKRLFVNTLLVLVSIALSVIGGELLLRIFYPQDLGLWSMTRDGMTIHSPNLKRYLPKFNQTIQINSYGMRDREHTLEKEKGIFRILLLGDSFMEAYQVSFEESFPSLLESLLTHMSHISIEVINASVAGWGTDDELAYFMKYGIRFKPDLVLIAMTLHNDVADNLVEEFHVYSNGELYERPTYEMPWIEFVQLETKTYLATHSHVYQVFLHYWRSSQVQAGANLLDAHVADLIQITQGIVIKKGWEMTDRLLGKMKITAERIGAKTAVVLLPLRIQTTDGTFNAFLTRHKLRPIEAHLRQPQIVMEEIGTQQRIEIIDLLPGFQKWTTEAEQPLYLEKDGHWNEYGHSLAAKIAAKEILRRNLVDYTSRGLNDIDPKKRDSPNR